MLLKQISVFLENKSGQLSEFVDLLAQNQIDLRALSIAEAQDYGVLRIIVDKPEETLSLLRAQNWICTATDVLAVTVPDEPGSLTKILKTLADKDVSLAYTYAFLSGDAGKACIILRVDDNAWAEKLLKDAGVIC